jgi:hypothetical protein
VTETKKETHEKPVEPFVLLDDAKECSRCSSCFARVNLTLFRFPWCMVLIAREAPFFFIIFFLSKVPIATTRREPK